ncbi:putative signal transducing protein [Jejudonia soesokkakensis]|uniref:Signal transducing protein n=1 Tax=Jejudonia soesokkakensis TaxID=1323432 RepID=A0ABW2MN63_9FLAO
MKDFKTIAIFTFPSEYAVLRLLLEQEEIDHVFLNETMVSVLPFHSNAFGGIRLKVHELDIERATQIIKNMDQASHLRIV